MLTDLNERACRVAGLMLAGALALGTAGSASAALVVELSANTDGTATLDGGVFDVVKNGSTLDALLDGSVDQRIALDIPLDALPADIVVTSATMTSEVSGFSADSGDPAYLWYAYAGDGFVDDTDAFNGDIAGTSDPVTALGQIVVSLDPALINAILAGDPSHLGLVGRAAGDGQAVSIYSNDGEVRGEGTKSVLRLEYEVVPEPTSLVLIGLGGLGLLARRRR